MEKVVGTEFWLVRRVRCVHRGQVVLQRKGESTRSGEVPDLVSELERELAEGGKPTMALSVQLHFGVW